MSNPGWIQPAAHIDADVAVVIHAADMHEIAIAARLPDDVRARLLAFIDDGAV